MSRAEARAEEYIKKSGDNGMTYADYTAGYEQAEKDLALIPEDIGVIFNLVLQYQHKYSATIGCYEEVLRLFNEGRNGKT